MNLLKYQWGGEDKVGLDIKERQTDPLTEISAGVLSFPAAKMRAG